MTCAERSSRPSAGSLPYRARGDGEQYNQYKSIHKQLAKVKPEKREQFEQRHSRELILYDAAARYLKELERQRRGDHPEGMAAGN